MRVSRERNGRKPVNLARLLSITASRHPEKPAIVFDGESVSYRAFDQAVERHAALLHAEGIGRGDCVAIRLAKRLEFLYLHLAALSVGAITLPLNPAYREEEVGYFLSDSGSALYITDAEQYPVAGGTARAINGVRTLLVGDAAGQGAGTLADRLARAPRPFQRSYAAEGDDVAMICYTSGTTGRSKGAMITHRNLVSNMLALSKAWEWTENDVLLHVLPLFHVHGLCIAAHGSLYAGSTTVMHGKFEPRRAWEALETGRCTLLMAVPTIYQRLLGEWERLERKPDLRAMRVFISGSAPLSDALFRRFEEATGFRILERYGMTETGMNTSNGIDPDARKARSVGHPLPGVEIRIVADDGSDAAAGEVGEVWIRGGNVFPGYRGMPEKTRESFVDGWFRSGDLGYRDPRDGGRLYLVGRAKELIITGGYNVYPKEVENVLDRHEAVRESAVVGLPDEEFGEKVAALVVLRAEPGTVTPEILSEYCRSRLASYKCPKVIAFAPDLPRNAMGKVLKDRVAERLPGNAADRTG
jgi:malonyl-CoA/methylmalonyl-CoA synthetase